MQRRSTILAHWEALMHQPQDRVAPRIRPLKIDFKCSLPSPPSMPFSPLHSLPQFETDVQKPGASVTLQILGDSRPSTAKDIDV